jgi:hypothetical protein
MGWTQPVCYDRFKQMVAEWGTPDREPVRLNLPESEWEACCYCRTPTNIYVRLDPKTVPYPKAD